MDLQGLTPLLTFVAGSMAAFLRDRREAGGEEMGFRPDSVVYNLKFEGENDPLNGLEVRMASVTVREYNVMMREGLKRGEEGLEANEALLQKFVDCMIKWNWDGDDGEVLPMTLESLLGLDRRYVGKMIQAWQMALAGVSEELGKALASGDKSLEEQLGLANSSQSPSN